MSTGYSRPKIRKRHDYTAIIMMVVSIIALPVVGVLVWKMYQSGGKLEIGKKTPVATAPAAHGPVKPTLTRQPARMKDVPDDTDTAMNEGGSRVVQTFQLGGSDDVPSGADDFGGQGRPGRRRGGFAENPGRGFGNGGRSGGMSMSSRSYDVPGSLKGVEGVLADALSVPKKTLVVWLFDRTASCAQLRQEVAGQIPEMYKRLAAKGEGDDATLLSVVGEFGADFNLLTESPESDPGKVHKAIESVKADEGFVENTFGAIKSAVEKVIDYRKKKGRFVTIVVVTDEIGNDRATIDEVLPKLTPFGIPVQVVGPSALFGQVEGFNRLAEGEPKPGEIRVMQGPETHDVDWIHLDSAMGNVDTSGVETGLGPYHLARLCRETDGHYFTLSHGGNALKGLEPQYMSEAEYQKQVEANKARKALIAAGVLPHAEVLHGFSTSFENADEVRRNRALETAQRPVAKVMLNIDHYIDALKGGEPDLAKLAGSTDKRWRAAFELAYARAAAAKVRHQGFLELTGQMKGGRKFQNESSTLWVLESTDEPMNVSALDKMASKARDYLNHVIKDYPDTPFAQAAERELQTKMSWKWVEK